MGNPNPSVADREHIRVSLVDDHRLVLDGLEARLRDADGIELVAIETTWSQLVAHSRFPGDVTVLDLYLDDHIPVTAKLGTIAAAGGRAVVISRHADPGAVATALRAGAKAFVPKTAGVDDLLAAIRSVAEGGEYLAPELSERVEAAGSTADPNLGRREQRALLLYARGHNVREVAAEMGTTEETVKSYIKRARRKYREVGVDIGTRILLRRHAVREGWLAPDSR